MRIALVHDWLVGMRGGERCLDELVALCPDSEIFTLVHRPGSVSRRIENRPIHTSFIDRLPRARTAYRFYLPLFPAAIGRFDLSGFDLVISTSSCVAHAVRTPGVPHLCYCFTPMRYLWDLYDSYFGRGRAVPPVRAAMAALAPRLRRWDRASAERIGAIVACSQHIRDRIRRCWGRDSRVVYPPVDIDRFRADSPREDFYLIVSELVPYKRVDVAVRAFNRLGLPLVIIGDGPERKRLRRDAASNVRFTGRLSDRQVADHLARCRGFVYTALEDFGIAVVEAQAAGAPVIAYGAGGALETVSTANGLSAGAAASGILFREQTAGALADAIRGFETTAFDSAAVRDNACRFSRDAFRRGIREEIRRLMRPVAA